MDPVLNDLQIKVTRIDQALANKIIENPNNSQFKGRFYLIEEDKTYTCIDNTEGEAYTENFSSIVKAAYWLM